MNPKVSIIMPAFNEEERIYKNAKKVYDYFNSRKSRFELIIVDDGSTDNTAYEASRIKKKNVKSIGYPKNAGKGNAILHGVSKATGDYVIFLDSDLEIDVSYAYDLFLSAIESGADIAILSKNHPKSTTNFPLYRKILSRGYYIFAKILFRIPVSDTQTGCKVFRLSVLKNVRKFLSAKRFCFDLELLAYINKLGYKITEKPIHIRFKREKSRVRISSAAEMFFDTLVTFIRYHRNIGLMKKGVGGFD